MIVLIVLVAIVNGITSPFVFVLFQIAPAWVPTALMVDLRFVLYLASLACATLTLLVAGVPAALYERARGLPATDRTSQVIWLISTLVLSLPGLHNLLTGGSGL